jgi:probable HAF family extracellular repeat protein
MKTSASTHFPIGVRDARAPGALTLLCLGSAIVATLSAAPAADASEEVSRLPQARNYAVHPVTLNGAGCKVGAIDAGAAAGTCNTPAGGATRAVIWTEAAGVVDIGTLGGASAGAGAIDGRRVAGASDIAGDGELHAFRWTALQGMVDLGTLGGTFSGASSVSGNAVVGESTTLAGDVHGFSSTPATGMIDLGTLAAGTESSARDLHNGLIAGFSATSGVLGRRPVAWKTDGQLIDIVGEPIEPVGFGLVRGSGEATAVRNGLVVGFKINSALQNRAFAWREGRGLTDLGVPPGSSESFAADTDGELVVGQLSGVGGPSGSTTRAFVWTRQSGIFAITPASITARATHVANGRVVGVYSTPETNGTRVFLWTKRRGLVDVTPRDFPGGFAPAGIDADGRIAIVLEDEDPANRRSAILVPR